MLHDTGNRYLRVLERFVGYRDGDFISVPKSSAVRMFHECFTICLFISPDLDGYRAPKGINPTRPTRSRNPNTKNVCSDFGI